MENSIVILGAGAAGLAAARELLAAGQRVTLLEARDRLGGRLHTICSGPKNVPVELGAEFIHGESTPTSEVLREAKLGIQKVPDHQWRFSTAGLNQDKGFWNQITMVMERLNPATPDQDFQSFLDEAWGLDAPAKTSAKHYVEGFHAAAANRLSVHALAQAEQASEKQGGTHQFRVTKGYLALVKWWEEQLRICGANIQTGAVVRQLRWQQGHVLVQARTPAGGRQFEAARALVTLPLGVLRSTGAPGSVLFDPALQAHETAARSLEVASVVKITLLFRSRFWAHGNFGFIHAPELAVPTWWSDGRGPVLTGWSGGPKAQRLAEMGADAALEEAIRTLATILGTETARIREQLVASYSYDWLHDPFTLGAYSYTPPRMGRMVRQLASPVADTLFFAGEATNTQGDQGTVHGAIATGLRAARQILEAARTPRAEPSQGSLQAAA